MIRSTLIRALVAFLLGLLPLAALAGQLTGTVAIRERVALPPDAQLELTVVDASAGNVEYRMEHLLRPLGGPLPLRFRIDYDGTRYQSSRYYLRATISWRGQVLFHLEPPLRVRMDNDDVPLQLVLTSTGASRADLAPLPGVPPGGPGLVMPPSGAPVAMTGMFSLLADAPRLVLCADGRGLPVAMEGDFRSLEAAYRRARVRAGQPVLVELHGRIVSRPSMEARRPAEATVLVDRFDAIRPGEACPQARPDAPLRGTTWRLVRLGDRAASTGDPQRDPYFTIAADGAQVSGHGGCNRMSGPVQINGNRIAVGGLAATRMACPALAQETAFFDALERAAAWRVTGQQLELVDSRGTALARFEALPGR